MKGPILLVAGLAGGILVGDGLGPGSARAMIGVAVVVLVVAYTLTSSRASPGWRRRWAVGALVLVGAVAAGTGLEQRALAGRIRSPLAGPARNGHSGEALITLVDDPGGSRFSTEVLARVTVFAGRDAGGRTVLAVGSASTQSALLVLDAGDRVLVRGRLAPLTGWSERLRWRHAVARLTLDDVIAVAPPADPWYRVANGARRAVMRGAAVLPSTPRALLAGFVLGDTRAIPDDVVVAFRAAGLSHLLAVSGANVAFALAVVQPLLGRMPRWARLVGGVTVIVTFGAMTRWEPSVARAAAMAGLVMLARALGRPAAAPRVLCLAVAGLLVVDPFLLHSVGFLLSCGACAGIVVGAAPIAARLPGPPALRDALGVTTAAQIGVSPVLLATFGSIPLVALPANLLAAPFVGPLTIWGLVASTVGGVIGRAASVWLELPTLAMLRAIEIVARQSARTPFAIDGHAAGMIAGGVAIVALLRRWPRLAGRLTARGRSLHREGYGSGPP